MVSYNCSQVSLPSLLHTGSCMSFCNVLFSFIMTLFKSTCQRNVITDFSYTRAATYFDSDETFGPVDLSVVVIRVTRTTSINPHLLVCVTVMQLMCPLLLHSDNTETQLSFNKITIQSNKLQVTSGQYCYWLTEGPAICHLCVAPQHISINFICKHIHTACINTISR